MPGAPIFAAPGTMAPLEFGLAGPGAVPAEDPAILAIDPALSMAEAMAVRRRIANPDLILTTLDRRWLEALKEMSR